MGEGAPDMPFRAALPARGRAPRRLGASPRSRPR